MEMDGQAAVMAPAAIGKEQIQEFTRILQQYKAGKNHTDQRCISAENWWKLRNSAEEQNFFSGTAKTEQELKDLQKNPAFKAKSGWLHNVIVSKHADAMESYPEAIFLPREADDQEEAKRLSSIMPVIMDQIGFRHTYSAAMWDKMKTGTAIYRVLWDGEARGGMGDISIENVNVLSLFWEPGIVDIQKSQYLFQTELVDEQTVIEEHPELQGKLQGNQILASQYAYDDNVSNQGKITKVHVYYHKRNRLHYCQYVGDHVLYATENDPNLRDRGLYDHGKYPYVFDVLYPIQGSPCGYGFVDLGKNPQTLIDFLNTSFVKSARLGASPRVFCRSDAGVNREQYANPDISMIECTGTLDEKNFRVVEHHTIDGAYLNVAQATVNELRETTGNTDASTGNAPSGVTAASAIAALQEASGKGSRDSTATSHYAFGRISLLCVDLLRQFGSMPRSFRIRDENGQDEFVSYDNRNLRPVYVPADGPVPESYRTPVFDIDIKVQRKSTYTRIAQNELALQFFQLGFFNPQMTDQALMTLDMMDFEGKEQTMEKIRKMGDMAQKLQQYQQLSMMLATIAKPDLVPQIQQDMAASGMAPQMPMGAAQMPSEQMEDPNESSHMQKARQQSAEATQPN